MEALATAVIAALTLGLLGGAHCVAMCSLPIARWATPSPRAVGVILLAPAAPAPSATTAVAAAQFHAGRVVGYALLGFVAGSAGGAIAWAQSSWMGSIPLQTVWAVVVTWCAVEWLCTTWQVRGPLQALGLGVGMSSLHRALNPQARGHWTAFSSSRFIRGAVWALLPCGLIYAALPLALLAGDALGGAAVMAAFALGTLPWHVGALQAFRRTSASARWLPRAVGALLMACAVALAWQPHWLFQWLPTGLVACVR